MSSFIGHGLAAVTTFAATPPWRQPFISRLGTLLWMGWLIVLAWMPDIDYAFPILRMSQHEGMRITHAVASSLLVPVLTGMALYAAGLRSEKLRTCCWQSAIAGLSHILMDFCVGVIGLPLLWPFHKAVIAAPIGLLPSAGSPHWQNYYFYQNLLIELGIVVPIMIVFLCNLPWQTNKLKLWQSLVLIGTAAYFLQWSIGLSR
ncbi:MAG: metal-dependent hydrolase [Cyanobacteria bacterium P01_C01_bin.121]